MIYRKAVDLNFLFTNRFFLKIKLTNFSYERQIFEYVEKPAIKNQDKYNQRRI
ncbi:hypothetical protein BH18ACI1_BH18ACI1_05620 [soil metagenome]